MFHELVDYPLEGAEFTGSKCQEELAMSRLDRFFVSSSWEEMFPLA